MRRRGGDPQVHVGNGLGIAVRLGTTDLPRYPSMGEPSAYGALQLLAPSRAHLRSAYGDFGSGG